MRRLATLCCALLATGALAPAARADLAEPAVNRGATQVRVEGTTVHAEAWAKAHGHRVEAIVVTRLVPRAGAQPKVETYERWSLDGKTRFERGSKKLGRAWEKHLWALLAEAEKGTKAGKRKRGELLDRLQRAVGPRGSREVGGYAVGWSLGHGASQGGGKRSLARVAVFTVTPGAPTPDRTPPAQKQPTTPRAGSEKAPKAQKRAPRKKGPVTPAPKKDERWPFPFPKERLRGPSFGGGSASGSCEGRADSKTGVRKHARVTVDLDALLPPTTKKPAQPQGPVTPKQK